MLILEGLVLIVVLAFVANGVKAGSIETLGRVLGAVVGFVMARYFAGWLVGIVGLLLPVEWSYIISFVIIFLVVDSLVGLLFKVIENLLKIFTRLPILKQLNGLLGGVFGFLEAVIVIGGISWLMKQSAAQAGEGILMNLHVVNIIDTVFESIFLKLL